MDSMANQKAEFMMGPDASVYSRVYSQDPLWLTPIVIPPGQQVCNAVPEGVTVQRATPIDYSDLNSDLTEQVCCEYSQGRFLFLSLKPPVSLAPRPAARVVTTPRVATTPRVRDYDPNRAVASIFVGGRPGQPALAASASGGNVEMDEGDLGIPYSRSQPGADAMEQQEYFPRLSDRGPKTHYREMGVQVFNQFGLYNSLYFVKNRGGVRKCQNFKMRTQGKFPEGYRLRLGREDKSTNEFKGTGDGRVGVLNDWPMTMVEHFKYMTAWDVPAKTNDSIVSTLFALSLLHIISYSHSIFQCNTKMFTQVRSVTHGAILFISEPPDDNARCSQHPDGCGKSLRVNDLVMVDGTEMEFVCGDVVHFAVRRLNHCGVRGCKVGIMRALPGQCHLFGNRVGVVSEIQRRTGEVIQTWSEPSQTEPHETQAPRKDRPESHSDVKQESKKGKAKKSKKRDDLHDPNDKTREVVKDCRGVATMAFLDGGGNTLLPIGSRGAGAHFGGFVHGNNVDENIILGQYDAGSLEELIEIEDDGSLESKGSSTRGNKKRKATGS